MKQAAIREGPKATLRGVAQGAVIHRYGLTWGQVQRPAGGLGLREHGAVLLRLGYAGGAIRWEPWWGRRGERERARETERNRQSERQGEEGGGKSYSDAYILGWAFITNLSSMGQPLKVIFLSLCIF